MPVCDRRRRGSDEIEPIGTVPEGVHVEIDPPDDDDAVDMTDEAAEGLQTW